MQGSMGTDDRTASRLIEAVAKNRRTVAMYEGYARNYALLISPTPPADRAESLQLLAGRLRSGADVLEVGSGTGRDADYLESLGLRVRRTDATEAFIQIQAERGRHAERLDVLDDDLGGPYDAVLAMCVLIHIAPQLVDGVLGRIRRSTAPGGAFLVSMREGVGEVAPPGGSWHTTLWSRTEFADRLECNGFRVTWSSRHEDEDGEIWLTFLAVRDS